MWRLWAKALGEKAGKNKKEADVVALIRTVVLFLYMTTNIFIIAGVIRHWNDVEYTLPASDQLRIKQKEGELMLPFLL
jgi:hypothetical protein